MESPFYLWIQCAGPLRILHTCRCKQIRCAPPYTAHHHPISLQLASVHCPRYQFDAYKSLKQSICICSSSRVGVLSASLLQCVSVCDVTGFAYILASDIHILSRLTSAPHAHTHIHKQERSHTLTRIPMHFIL